VPAFRKIIRQNFPDIILSFMDRTNCLVLLSTIGINVPVIVSERVDPRMIKPGLLYEWLRNRLYPRAKALVTLGSEQANWFKPIARQTVTIPNPVFPCETSGQFINKKKIALAVGRLVKQKGFDLLIKGFFRIAKAYPDWRLIILGEGPERKNLENLVNQYGIGEQVKLPGVTLNIQEFYGKAAFLVLSSRFEGFPNVVTESLACGCPVVVTDCVDSIKDIVTHEHNGLIVPPEDKNALEMAMAKMMRDNELRSLLAKNARKSVAKFHISRITKMWEDLFNEVLKK
jgi:glycosyltransferase involved in cell wall biosynthesis